MAMTQDDFKKWQERFHGPIQDTLKQIFDKAGELELGFSISYYDRNPGTGVYASLFNLARHRGESQTPIPAEAIDHLHSRVADSLPEQGVKVYVRNCDTPIGP